MRDVAPEGAMVPRLFERDAVQLGELSNVSLESLAFGGGREPSQCDLEQPIDPLRNSIILLLQEPPAADVRLLNHKRIVEERQRLAGDLGAIASALRDFAAGEIERFEEARGFHQRELDVDAASARAIEGAAE